MTCGKWYVNIVVRIFFWGYKLMVFLFFRRAHANITRISFLTNVSEYVIKPSNSAMYSVGDVDRNFKLPQ